MGELLKNKVMHKKRVSKNISGVHISSHKPTEKCVMKMKQINKEKMTSIKMFLMEGGTS